MRPAAARPTLIAPYGGTLVDRRLAPDRRAVLLERARDLPAVPISDRTLSDVALIANGALSPLDGFMTPEDYTAVLEEMRLASGLPWTLPITLAVDAAVAAHAARSPEVALIAPDGRIAAVLTVTSVFRRDRELEAVLVYGTTEVAHPGVAALLGEPGDHLLAGPIDYLYDQDISGFPALHLEPGETRAEIARRGWRSVVGFQTRNPVHRAHEYLQKSALETVDGLLLHPLVGATKADDVPADIRLACYRVLLDRYFPPERVLLSVLPAAMRYAGPREAIFHAVIRRNYGCTHFIVGRDHAGVGNYYGTYDAQEIFDRVDADALGIQPLRFEHAFHCRRCDQMATARTCPHDPSEHVHLSGTRVRELLARGERPPAAFSRPEVADVLARAYATTPNA